MSSVAAARLRVAPLSLVRAVPAWAWVVALAGVSAAVHYALARRLPAPWIVADELVYSELAKSFADSGSFEVRDAPVGRTFGVVYPVLISPAYLLFERLTAAYEAAKAINALVISITAIPAYALARRVVSPFPAVVAAALAVAVPGMLYAGTIMTENAFYPLFVAAVLALVLAVERPTPGRTLLLLGVVAIAFLTRSQAALLLPAIATTPLLLVALERRGAGALRAYAWFYGLLFGAVAAVLVLQTAGGRSPLALLGSHRTVGEVEYDLGAVPKWILWHVAELDLALGFVPFAALLLLLALAPQLDDRARVFVAAATSVAVWTMVGVAVFASRHALRIEERNLFYVEALFLIALVAWVERGLPRPRAATAVAVSLAAALPAFLPFSTLISVSAVSDTFGLMPWWDFHEWGVPLDQLWIGALLSGMVAALLVVLWPRRLAYGLPVLVFLYFALSAGAVQERMRTASIGALFQGMTLERDWVDRAVGREAEVAALYSGALDRFSVVQNEFFSRSVGPVYTLGPELPANVQTPVVSDPETGLFRDPAGAPVRVEYVLADDTVPVAGRLVRRDERWGNSLLRVDGPLRITHRVDGTYGDGWSGPTAIFTRFRCSGGTLVATMDSDARLFRRDQVVTARVGGRVVARARIPRTGRGRIRVPLVRRDGNCRVVFAVAPTAVPGPDDTRRLGTHFRTFRYRP